MKACGPIVLTALLLVSSAGTAAATALQFIDPGPIGATFVLTNFDFLNATDLRFELRFVGGKLVTYSGNSGVAGATGFY